MGTSLTTDAQLTVSLKFQLALWQKVFDSAHTE
jgi:hypothetical protein